MDSPRLILYSLQPDDVTDPDKVSSFWEQILKKYLPETELEEPRLLPLQMSLRHAMNLGCLSVVFQQHVQDPDFAAEYHAYHGRLFSQVGRYCARMHLFRKSWGDGKDVLLAIDEVDEADYLGFITLRPVTVSPVGATILRPPQDGVHFFLSTDKFDVHLAGRTFSVQGTPFMQQDNAVGACAQASIWMALRTLRKREGLAAHDPAQITTSATRFMVRGRTLPNRDGLEISQMMEAVRSAGYSATLLSFREPGRRPSRELLPRIKTSLYPYIESEIPVILAMTSAELGGHAVVLIGHGWGGQPMVCSPTIIQRAGGPVYVRNAVDWATPFYIHNDNSGPYLPIPDSGTPQEFSLDKVCYAIPLLPADVYMTAEEAEQAALRMIYHFGGDGFLNCRTHVVRTYLQERYKFRAAVRAGHMVDSLKTYYRMKRLPHRMWVTEINLREGYDEPLSGRAQRIGEVIIDPTGEPTQAPFLSIHTPGILIDRDPDSEKIRLIPLQDDRACSPLVRQPRPQ